MLRYEVRQHELNWDVLIWCDNEIIGTVAFQGINCAMNAYEYCKWKSSLKEQLCKS